MNFNKVLLMGNLTRDPETRQLQSGTSLTQFGMAVNRKWKDKSGEAQDEVLFVDCTAWGKTGEVIAQYFVKGKPIFVEGHLRLEQWEDKQGGGKRSKISVTVDSFQFVGGRDEGEKREPRRQAAPQSLAPVDEDIPF